jgi:glycosyltransferase involved in cell wall biosynthesis
MKKITVFTPTYNRAFCLDQLYQSLLSQTNTNFLWLIVDDGSSDNTKELVELWIRKNIIEIHYIYQENQGMHSAHNTAYKAISTELNVCIDSDDFMPFDAIDLIQKKWSLHKNESLAGLIGLDAFKDGGIVGDQFPSTLQTTTLTDLYQKHKLKGDKKVVIRTSVVKEFPLYPVYHEERLVPLSVLYLMIDQKYKWQCTNDVYCVVEYLEGGSSRNIVKQYQKSPKGFGYSRRIEMTYSTSFLYTFTRAIHYVSSCLFQKKLDFFSDNPKKIITFFAIPFGFIFHFFILYKIKK